MLNKQLQLFFCFLVFCISGANAQESPSYTLSGSSWCMKGQSKTIEVKAPESLNGDRKITVNGKQRTITFVDGLASLEIEITQSVQTVEIEGQNLQLEVFILSLWFSI